MLKNAQRITDPLWRNFCIALYAVSWKQWELYEKVEDARYSHGGYFQFRHEFRHLERRIRSDGTVRSPNREERASYSALRRLLIFISNFFLVSATYVIVISSDTRGVQFVVSYRNNDNDAQSYLNELRACSTYAICLCVYSIKSELFYSKATRLLLRQVALSVSWCLLFKRQKTVLGRISHFFSHFL